MQWKNLESIAGACFVRFHCQTIGGKGIAGWRHILGLLWLLSILRVNLSVFTLELSRMQCA